MPQARLGGEEDRQRPEPERAKQAHDVIEELRTAARQARRCLERLHMHANGRGARRQQRGQQRGEDHVEGAPEQAKDIDAEQADARDVEAARAPKRSETQRWTYVALASCSTPWLQRQLPDSVIQALMLAGERAW